MKSSMNRRNFLSTGFVTTIGALAATPAFAGLLAACGDDTRRADFSVPEAPTTVGLRITSEGGFVPVGVAFVNLPSLLITEHGQVFEPGAMLLIYPGPLLPALTERTITSEGLERVRQLAEDSGLLAGPFDYSLPDEIAIADAPDTVVRITVNGTVYEHRANALGLDTPNGGASTPARENLLTFVRLVTDIAQVAGVENIGEPREFHPDQYRFQAMVVDPSQFTDPSPTIVDWPPETGVVLADAGQCATVEATAVDALFGDATQLTFFAENEVVYQISAVGVLPGDATC